MRPTRAWIVCGMLGWSVAACHAPGGGGSDASPAGSPSAPPGDSHAPRAAAAPARLTVPAGTRLVAVLDAAVSSDSAAPGDRVSASLDEPVRVGDAVVLPAGARLRGRVTAAQGSGRVKGKARLAFRFETLNLDGRELDVRTIPIDVTAGDSHKRDAVVVGGSTGAGAVVGAIAGGGKGARKGALIGLAAGAGAVLATKGEEVEFAAGTRLRLELSEPLEVGPQRP